MKYPGILAVLCLVLFPLQGWAQEDYDTGGPLAGLKLPLFKTQHGEPAGYPGCLVNDQGSFIQGPEGQYPEVELYPGAEEHWRAYWFHYMPIRSFFDRQSQLKNFVAPDIAGARADQQEQYAAPVTWLPTHGPQQPTGKTRRPVPVIRCQAGAPVLKLDLGELPRGLYVVRVIGAVETKNIRPFLLPIFMKMRINDGVNGGQTDYRMRIGYTDEFYSVAELYFHATEKRRFQAEVSMDRGSQTELLVHNISLDDALAGTRLQRVKRRKTGAVGDIHPVHDEGYFGKRTGSAGAERLARDEAIWNAYPPLNVNGNFVWAMGPVVQGAEGKPLAQVEAVHGAWKPVSLFEASSGREAAAAILHQGPLSLATLAANEKLGLKYAIDELAVHKPLPDPFPFKDDGAGLYYPDPAKPNDGMAYVPLSWAVMTRMYEYSSLIASGSWLEARGASTKEYAHDSAIALVRLAYQFPTLDINTAIGMIARDPGPAQRPIFRRRHTSYSPFSDSPVGFMQLVESYDRLFEYIDGNEELAQSVNRFIPWVKTSDDVIALLDAYLVQTTVKRMMRYHYFGDGRQPEFMAKLAILAGNPEFTDPWMEWYFKRTFLYPNAPAGIQDIAISGTDRDGRSTIGSFSYMVGEYASFKTAEELGRYVDLGGNKKYDLRDFDRYPKSLASLDFEQRLRTAGIHFPRFGSSSGPEKHMAAGFFPDRALIGWKWTKAPRFAYVVKHYVGRGDQSDEQWQEIESAADQLKRPPWMDQTSRFLPTVGAYLETGLEHDDYRFRRSVWVRTAAATGHNHNDTLDLQVHAHGLPMTVDSGQRRDTVYSRPRDIVSAIHNTVVVNGQDFIGYAWPRAISDGVGARYLCAQAIPPGAGIELLRRQVALLDVDEGQGSVVPLGPAQFHPRPTGMPKGVVTSNSYVFDVFRAAGANDHTYCFHATVGDFDGPQPAITLAGLKTPEQANEPDEKLAVQWLNDYFGQKYLARITGDFDVTFPLVKERTPAKDAKGKGPYGSESFWLQGEYDPAAPAKFTRLHVLGAQGAMFMKGDQHCMHYEYTIPQVFIRRIPAGAQSAFVAIIEPYAGQPFITDRHMLPVADNENDALRAVAVELKTVNGHTDICFADGRPDKTRVLGAAIGAVQMAGEFGYLSTDNQGLRQASLTGGRLLESPQVYLQPEAAQWQAGIVRVDYFKKTAWTDKPLPERDGPLHVELGAIPEGGREGYITGFTAMQVRRDGAGSAVIFREGGDLSRGPVTRVDPQGSFVAANAALPVTVWKQRKGFAASNDRLTRFWRADAVGGDSATNSPLYKLTGDRLSAADFEPDNALRLWEYGPGDTLRRSTMVNLRRLESGIYELQSDVACTIGLQAAGLQISRDGKAFAAMAGEKRGALFLVKINDALLGPTGKVWLRK